MKETVWEERKPDSDEGQKVSDKVTSRLELEG